MRSDAVRQALVRWGLPLAFFACLTVVMTWPQAAHLEDRNINHQDVYFNMWRLEWFAHAITTDPRHLFDANIFYPERRTLTYSDAMIVEGLVALPLIALHLPPMLVHNLLLLGAIVVSGLGMYVLVRYLTGRPAAGLLAGAIFCFAPYRFEHYVHMELQWTLWMPWAFWALHRTLETGRIRFGLTTGGMLALQMLSSIYYGIFLATLLAICGGLLFLSDRRARAWPAARSLASGAALAAVICGLYAMPYLRTRAELGNRPVNQISRFSATPWNYLAPTPSNWLYGGIALDGPSERRLFPGVVPVVLAMMAVLLRAPAPRQIVYLLGLALAFEMSLGFRGFLFTFLYDHIVVYRVLRAPARLGIFVVMFIAVLASYGYAALAAAARPRVRGVLAGILIAVVLAEYAVRPLHLVPYPNEAPGVYRYLVQQPRGLVAELPTPTAHSLPGDDPRYSYLSIFHWFPLVNGYSGYYPRSYLARVDRLAGFPDADAIEQLHRDGVRYVILHTSSIRETRVVPMLAAIDSTRAFIALGHFGDGRGSAYLYRLR